MAPKMTRKKPGPKRRPAAAVRGVMIRVMVRPAEFDEIRQRAGMESMSSYLREKGLGR